MGTRAGFYS